MSACEHPHDKCTHTAEEIVLDIMQHVNQPLNPSGVALALGVIRADVLRLIEVTMANLAIQNKITLKYAPDTYELI